MENDIYEKRRAALDRYIKSLGRGGIARVAERIGRSESYVSRLLYPIGKSGGKRIADVIVRALNENVKGWDAEESEAQENESAISTAAEQLINLIRKHSQDGSLSDPLIQTIDQMIRLATIARPPVDNEDDEDIRAIKARMATYDDMRSTRERISSSNKTRNSSRHSS